MVNASSAPFEHGDDEARLLDIHMEDSSTVAPQRVAESPASIECRLERIVEVGSAYVVFGAVSAITVRDDVLVDGHPGDGAPAARVPPRRRRVGPAAGGLPPDQTDEARRRALRRRQITRL